MRNTTTTERARLFSGYSLTRTAAVCRGRTAIRPAERVWSRIGLSANSRRAGFDHEAPEGEPAGGQTGYEVGTRGGGGDTRSGGTG